MSGLHLTSCQVGSRHHLTIRDQGVSQTSCGQNTPLPIKVECQQNIMVWRLEDGADQGWRKGLVRQRAQGWLCAVHVQPVWTKGNLAATCRAQLPSTIATRWAPALTLAGPQCRDMLWAHACTANLMLPSVLVESRRAVSAQYTAMKTTLGPALSIPQSACAQGARAVVAAAPSNRA